MSWSLRSDTREYVIVGPVFIVGRGRGADISLDDPSVSRRHAALTIRRGVLFVEDLGSRNGTAVNGRPTRGVVALSLGDGVSFGACRLLLGQSALAAPRHPERVTEPVGPTVPVPAQAVKLALLSSRERHVFALLAHGRSQRAIAGALGVSVKTVQTYRTRIGQKLELRDRAELIRFALETGVLRRE